MHSNKSILVVAGSKSSVGAVEIYDFCQNKSIECSIHTLDDPSLPPLLDNNFRKAIYRIGPKSFDAYQNTLLPRLPNEDAKKGLVNVINAFDKTISAVILQNSDIAVPNTTIINASSDLENLSLPIVIKVGVGNQGAGVYLVRTMDELNNTVNELLKTSTACVAQEYVEESKGSDKRLFVIAGKVVAAMQRTANTGDFRANLHLGGSAKNYIPSELESALALRATKAHDLLYAGVDIIDSNRGPLVLEVNPSPGFAISKITGVDIISELVSKLKGEEYD